MAPINRDNTDGGADASGTDPSSSSSSSSSSPSPLHGWAIALIVIFSLGGLAAIVALVVFRSQKAQYRRDQLLEPSLSYKAWRRRQNMGAAEREEEEERQRAMMIRKTLASRASSTASIVTTATTAADIDTKHSSGPASLDSGSDGDGERDGSVGDDLKDWEAGLRRSRSSSDGSHPLRGPPSVAEEPAVDMQTRQQRRQQRRQRRHGVSGLPQPEKMAMPPRLTPDWNSLTKAEEPASLPQAYIRQG